jgi:hypothetical protein
MQRAARIADGWHQPLLDPASEEGIAKRDRLFGYLREAGRDPKSFGLEGWSHWDPDGPDAWRARLDAWESWGATHASVRMFQCGLSNPAEHIAALRTYKDAIGQ